jgi:GNAT superfamily N-acetyltransferase
VKVPGRLSVRPADLDDLASVVELRLALLREYADHPLYGRLRPDARARAYELYRGQLSAHNERIFVAELDGDVVGVLRCVDTLSSPLLYPERYCYVSSVYVRPRARRTGVLRALLAAAEAWCDERGIDEMRLHNATSSAVAERTWSALGFEVVEHVRRRATRVAAPAAAREHDHVEAH